MTSLVLPSTPLPLSRTVPLGQHISVLQTLWNISRFVSDTSILLCFSSILKAIAKELDAAVVQLPYQSLSTLPPTHDIRHLVRRILFLAADSTDRQIPLTMSQKVVQLLYKTTSQLGRELYVAILDQLCRLFEDVAKEAITWLIYSEDEASHLIHWSLPPI
jgi:hypothetical protein